MSTSSNFGFERLADTGLNMIENKIQHISPHLRVYAINMVEILENKYPRSGEFIEENKININNYIFKNLKEYDFDYNFKVLKM